MKNIFQSILFLVFIFSISLTTAISTDLKDSYKPRETIIIEFSGQILQPIQKEHVSFLRGHVEVPFIYDIKKIGDKYYLYAQSPNNSNNYTLKIEDISTSINGVPTIEDYSKNFSIQGDTIPYSIDPGFAVFREGFEFRIFSYNDSDEKILIDYPEEKEITINPGENTLFLNKKDGESGFTKINIGSYSVPIFVQTPLNHEQEESTNLSIFPSKIDSIILFNETPTYFIRVFNPSSFAVSQAYFELNNSIFMISPELFPQILPNSSIEFNLTLKTTNAPILENITLKSGDSESTIQINIKYTQNESQTRNSLDGNNFPSSGYYCKELDGEFCTSNEECSTDLIDSLDGKCCTSSCMEKTEASFTWIGWVFGILIIGIIIWIYIRYKKSKTPKTNPVLSRISKNY